MKWRCNERQSTAQSTIVSALLEILCFSSLLGMYSHYSTHKSTQCSHTNWLTEPSSHPFSMCADIVWFNSYRKVQSWDKTVFIPFSHQWRQVHKGYKQQPSFDAKKKKKGGIAKCTANPKSSTAQLLFMKHSRWKQVWVQGEEKCTAKDATVAHQSIPTTAHTSTRS